MTVFLVTVIVALVFLIRFTLPRTCVLCGRTAHGLYVMENDGEGDVGRYEPVCYHCRRYPNV